MPALARFLLREVSAKAHLSPVPAGGGAAAVAAAAQSSFIQISSDGLSALISEPGIYTMTLLLYMSGQLLTGSKMGRVLVAGQTELTWANYERDIMSTFTCHVQVTAPNSELIVEITHGTIDNRLYPNMSFLTIVQH